MTRGQKSSERRACYHAFFAGFLLAGFGIWKGAALAGLAGLIVAVCGPLMWYAGCRTAYKSRHGEE